MEMLEKRLLNIIQSKTSEGIVQKLVLLERAGENKCCGQKRLDVHWTEVTNLANAIYDNMYDSFLINLNTYTLYMGEI